MAQASQAAGHALPKWLKFQAVPVGLFARVASSNLTPQDNDLEISNKAYIDKTKTVARAPAQNKLPEYRPYMDITESNKFVDILEYKPFTGNAGSDYHILVLVRQKSTSALAGCFLFDFAPAPTSSSSEPQESTAPRLLLQRVYPSTGVKASHWYHCLYAALFREILYKGFSLSGHLISAGLLPETRKAPGTVYSISPALPIVEDKLAHAVTEAAARTELLDLGVKVALGFARGSNFGWGDKQITQPSKLLYIVYANTNVVGYYLAVRSTTYRESTLYEALQPIPSASDDHFKKLIEQELYAIGYWTAADFKKLPDASVPWAAARSGREHPIPPHSNDVGIVWMRWLTHEEWTPLLAHQEWHKLLGFNEGHDHPPQFPPDEHHIYIACWWRKHQQAQTIDHELFLFRKDPRLAVDTLSLIHAPEDGDKRRHGLQACEAYFRSLGWAGSMYKDTVLPHLSSRYCHFLSSFTFIKLKALRWATEEEVIQLAKDPKTPLPHAVHHLDSHSNPPTNGHNHIVCSFLGKDGTNEPTSFLVFKQSAPSEGPKHLTLTGRLPGPNDAHVLDFEGFNQSLWEFHKLGWSNWVGIDGFDYTPPTFSSVLDLKLGRIYAAIQLQKRPPHDRNSDMELMYCTITPGDANYYWAWLVVQQGLRKLRHQMQASGWVGRILVKWPQAGSPMWRGLCSGFWEQENGAAPAAGKECHFVSF